jgi:hypothetical protein
MPQDALPTGSGGAGGAAAGGAAASRLFVFMFTDVAGSTALKSPPAVGLRAAA